MAVIGEAFIDVKSRTDDFESSTTSKLTSSLKKVVAAVGAAVAVDKVLDFGKSAFDAAIESQKIGAQTEAVIKSTGQAAGVTAGQVGDLVDALSKKNTVDDEAIQQGANLLLTFTNIKNGVGENNDIFTQANQVMIDMAAAMGTDVKGGAIQLGKALNDPVAGITALTRVGVTFTDQQKEQIKALAESGDVMGAQKIILAELNKEFGGSAAAQATATDRLKIAMGNLQEQIGAKLIPIVERFSTWMVSTGLPAMERIARVVQEKVMPVLRDVAEDVLPILRRQFELAGDIIERLAPKVEHLAEVVFPKVVAAIEFVQNEVENVREIFSDLGFGIEGFGTAIEAVTGDLLTALGVSDETAARWQANVRGAFENVVASVQGAMDDISAVVAVVLDFVQRLWRTFGDEILQVVIGYFELIRSQIESVMQVISGIIDVFMGIITGDWGRAWDGIRQIIDGIWTAIRGIVEFALTVLEATISAGMTIIAGLMDAAWAAVLAIIRGAWQRIQELTAQALQFVFDQIAALPGRFLQLGGLFIEAGVALINAYWDGLRHIAEAIGWLFTEIFNFLVGLPGSVAQKAIDAGFFITAAIGDGLRFIGDRLATLASDMIVFLAGLPGRVYGYALDIGSAIVNAVVEGVAGIGDAIWEKIKGGIGSIPGKISGVIGSINPFAEGGVMHLVGMAGGGVMVPGYAGGTQRSTTGLAIVGERGPELVQFGRTSSVFPNDLFEAAMMRAVDKMSLGGGSVVINVIIENVSSGNVHDVARIVSERTAQSLAQVGIGVSARQAAMR